MREKCILFVFMVIFSTTSMTSALSAQDADILAVEEARIVEAQNFTPPTEDPLTLDIPAPKSGPRYYLSTNLVNMVFMMGNVGFEVRFPRTFALKMSVFGGPIWLLNGWGTPGFLKGDILSMVGLRVEPRFIWVKNVVFTLECRSIR